MSVSIFELGKMKYYYVDMAGTMRFFKTKKEADKARKFIYEKTAIYPKLYRTENIGKKLRKVV